MMQLLEMLSTGSQGRRGGARSSGMHACVLEGIAPGRGPGGGGRPRGLSALQLILGQERRVSDDRLPSTELQFHEFGEATRQLLAGNAADGRGGPSVWAELLASLAPQHGIDQAAVAARTGEMVFREPECGARGGADSGSGGTVDEERNCMVCLEAFHVGEDLCILPCLHRYHKNCIDLWLARDRRCPVCKHDVTQ